MADEKKKQVDVEVILLDIGKFPDGVDEEVGEGSGGNHVKRKEKG